MKKSIILAAAIVIATVGVISQNFHKTRGNAASIDNKYGLYLASYRAEIMDDFFMLGSFYPEAVKESGYDFLNKLFIVEANNGNAEAAKQAAEAEMKKHPTSLVPVIYLAYADVADNNFKAASARFAKLPGEKYANFVVKLLRAWILVGEGKAEQAMDLVETELSNKAFEKQALVNLGLIASISGNNKYADEVFTEATKFPLDISDLELIAGYYVSKGKQKKAVSVISLAQKKSPSSVSVSSLLDAVENGYKPNAITTAKQGFAKALFDTSSTLLIVMDAKITDIYYLYISMVSNLAPDSYIAKIMKGEVFRKTGRPADYENLIKSVPHDHYLYSVARLNLAQSYIAAGDSKGVKILENLVKEYPAMLQTYITLGDYYRYKSDAKSAIKWYGKGLDKGGSPNLMADMHFSRGVAYDTLGKPEQAQKDLEKAVSLNSKSPEILNYYGYFLVEHNLDLDKGLKSIEMALALSRSNPYYIDSYGWAFFKKGDLAKGIQMLEFAHALAPRNSVIVDHLGDAYLAAGRKREAVFCYKKAIYHLKNESFNENLTEQTLRAKIKKIQD